MTSKGPFQPKAFYDSMQSNATAHGAGQNDHFPPAFWQGMPTRGQSVVAIQANISNTTRYKMSPVQKKKLNS